MANGNDEDITQLLAKLSKLRVEKPGTKVGLVPAALQALGGDTRAIRSLGQGPETEPLGLRDSLALLTQKISLDNAKERNRIANETLKIAERKQELSERTAKGQLMSTAALAALRGFQAGAVEPSEIREQVFGLPEKESAFAGLQGLLSLIPGFGKKKKVTSETAEEEPEEDKPFQSLLKELRGD